MTASSNQIDEFPNFTNPFINLILLHSNVTNLPSIDCIVNCTGPNFEHYGGISKAITNSAGPRIIKKYNEYLKSHNRLELGLIYVTKAYDLNQHKQILHLQTPKDKQWLGIIYPNIFEKCFNDLKMESLAVPLIGTGQLGLSLTDSVNIFLNSIKDFSVTKPIKIYIVNNNLDQLNETSKLIRTFLNLNEQKSQVIQGDCPICLDKIKQPKTLNMCNHSFCQECINEYFNRVKKVCPLCNKVYGLTNGNQPNGEMKHRVLKTSLPGYRVETIEIKYIFPDGVQGSEHPNPGQRYKGTYRIAYLPNDSDGRKVLDLLQKAYNKRLVFTIGQSRTTGQNNVITWNDIHHKTSIDGGPDKFGYPDPGYIQRVLQELADKGIQ